MSRHTNFHPNKFRTKHYLHPLSDKLQSPLLSKKQLDATQTRTHHWKSLRGRGMAVNKITEADRALGLPGDQC